MSIPSIFVVAVIQVGDVTYQLRLWRSSSLGQIDPWWSYFYKECRKMNVKVLMIERRLRILGFEWTNILY